MTEVSFYHLTRGTPDQALPPLLGRTLDAGRRALVRCPNAARVAALDASLWTVAAPVWLPHGASPDAPRPEWQPIWLTDDDSPAPNGATFLFRLDGAGAPALGAFERVFDLFAGDEASLVAARARWASAKAERHALAYWQQTASGWERRV